MTNSDLARKAHEALDEAWATEPLSQDVSALVAAHAAIDALAASGGHARNCNCHNPEDTGFCTPECAGSIDKHPYRDPRCSPSPLPQNARDKVSEALSTLGDIQGAGPLNRVAVDEATRLLESALAEPEQPPASVEICDCCGKCIVHTDEPEQEMPGEEELAQTIFEVYYKTVRSYENEPGLNWSTAVARFVLANFTGYRGKQ